MHMHTHTSAMHMHVAMISMESCMFFVIEAAFAFM